MEKPAENKYPIPALLKRRWSPRAIDSRRPVERGKLLSLLEAARWSPSCFNDQPWRFLVFDTTNAKALEQARSCLIEGNSWAKTAPLLLISVANENFAHNGKPNRHAQHDVGLATENLLLQAVESGLVGHAMAGFDAGRATELFKIPSGHTPMAMIAIGYPGDPAALNPKQQEMEKAPRARNEMAAFAFEGGWGTPVREKNGKN
jgi:nitroreductase